MSRLAPPKVSDSNRSRIYDIDTGSITGEGEGISDGDLHGVTPSAGCSDGFGNGCGTGEGTGYKNGEGED